MKFSLNAYGKINLTLDVLRKRADGFHEVEMVMQAIALADVLTFEPAERVELICTDPRLPIDERNLVTRTALFIKNKYKLTQGARITLRKNIPLAAGLAGGSSDAAAALYGLNLLWDLRLTTAELIHLAQELGSDVPFCLLGGTVLAQGRGEQLTLLPKLPKFWLVLVKPDFEVSTKEIYAHWSSLKSGQVNKSGLMVQAIKKGQREDIIKHLSNHLERVTGELYPEVLSIKEKLAANGALKAVMSGSGPTVYGVMRNEEEALILKQLLNKYYEQVYVTYTL